MKLNSELSEVVGAFIGDGCLSRYYSNSKSRWCEEVLFTGSWSKDSDYYKKIIGPIIEKYFNIKFGIYHRKDDNTVRFRSQRKEFVSFLLNLGFGFGEKSNNVEIPEVIITNKNLVKACIRGIFNTDGTIYRRYSKKYGRHPKYYSKYKSLQFKSNSLKLMEQVKLVLTLSGFNPNRIIKDRKSFVCRITSQDKIRKFEKEINTTHEYHMNRSKNISGPGAI